MLRRAILALLLLAVATGLALVATDVLAWRTAIRSGDRAFARNPETAAWKASTVLPGAVGQRLLGLGTPLRFRAAQQVFVAVRTAGSGYDNGLSEARTRGELEAELAELARTGDRVLASAADNLLGILAYADTTRSGPMEPAPVDQSVGDFQAAIRLDPGNEDAKVNLEQLLRALRAKGTRTGPSNSAGGPARGHHGAGGGIPGRGY